MRCPDCHNSTSIYDPALGELICSSCGLVLSTITPSISHNDHSNPPDYLFGHIGTFFPLKTIIIDKINRGILKQIIHDRPLSEYRFKKIKPHPPGHWCLDPERRAKHIQKLSNSLKRKWKDKSYREMLTNNYDCPLCDLTVGSLPSMGVHLKKHGLDKAERKRIIRLLIT